VEKVKNIAIFLVFVLGLSVCGQYVWEKYVPSLLPNYNITGSTKAEIIIEGSQKVKIGQLARLAVTKSAGKTFKWVVIPEGVDFEVYNNGQNVIFSSGTPGSFTFVVACANGNEVDIKVVVIIVGEGEVVNPINPVTPVPPLPAGLTGKVTEWTNLVISPAKKAEAAKLSASFAAVQAEIQSGKWTTAEEIIAATKAANQSALGASLAAWVPCLEKLQTEMRTQAESGLLVTPEQHAKMWGEIAAGLAAASK
jgi:hypothetical protein